MKVSKCQVKSTNYNTQFNIHFLLTLHPTSKRNISPQTQPNFVPSTLARSSTHRMPVLNQGTQLKPFPLENETESNGYLHEHENPVCGPMNGNCTNGKFTFAARKELNKVTVINIWAMLSSHGDLYYRPRHQSGECKMWRPIASLVTICSFGIFFHTKLYSNS